MFLQCLENPKNPQYNGGIVVNPEFKEGLKGWASFGNAKLQVQRSETGNEFIVAHQRNQSFDSASQEFFMDHEKLYTFSGRISCSISTRNVNGLHVLLNLIKFEICSMGANKPWR